MTDSDNPVAELLAAFADSPPSSPTQTLPRERTEPPALGPAIAAGPGGGERLDLQTTLLRRRSTRFYTPGPLPLATITDIIDRGLGHDAATWPEEQQATALQVDAVAFDIAELEPAIYRVDAARRSWLPLQALPAGPERNHLTLQPEFSQSAVVVSIAVDLESAWAGRGAHGYRLVMSRASAAAYTMWLEGIARGYAGSVFAGFLPAAVRLPLHSDGNSRHHCFALALGHPPVLPEPDGAPPPQ